jgi:NTP pyrophosphatase (non-canonical NTP hydrolase)
MSKTQHSDATTTLQAIKDAVAAYQAERGWDKLNPRNLAMSIVLEAAELMEHFQWGDEDLVAQRQSMADELADILTYCVEFALAADIDISMAFHDKLEHVKKKYPATVFNPDSKAMETYYQIKQEHRAKKGKGK